MLEPLPRVTTPVRLPNPRLWELHQRNASGVITPEESAELDEMLTEQENEHGR